MEKKSLIISLVSLIVIANAIVFGGGVVGIDDQENILNKISTTLITSVAVGIDDQENIVKDVQCYGYYGC